MITVREFRGTEVSGSAVIAPLSVELRRRLVKQATVPRFRLQTSVVGPATASAV